MGPSDLMALLTLDEQERTAKELGELLSLTSASITVLVDRLEASKLVQRKPNPIDRRSVILTLRPEGRRVVAKVQVVLSEDFRPAASRVPQDAIASVRDFIDGVAERQWERAREATAPGKA
jgi:DNA-binding MarR family transcriptional regulator